LTPWQDINVSEDHAASIFRMKTEEAWSSKMLISYHPNIQYHTPEDHN